MNESEGPTTQTGTSQRRPVSTRTFFALGTGLLLLSCLIAGITFRGLDLHGDAAEKLGEVIGRALVMGIIFGIIATRLSAKNRGHAFVLFSSLCAVYTIIFAYNFHLGHEEAKGRGKDSSQKIASSLNEMFQQATNGDVPQFKSTGVREIDESLKPVNHFSKELSSSLDDMENLISGLQAEEVFSTQVLKSKPAIEAEIRKRMESIKFIQRYQKTFPQMVSKARDEYALLRVSDSIKRGAIAGFEKSLKAQTPQLEEMFSLRLRQEYAERDFLKFMSGTFGDYRFTTGGKIAFTTSANVPKYEELTKEIEGTIKEAKAFQQHQFDVLEATRAKIQEFAK